MEKLSETQSKLCYVTAFLDLQRENWSEFKRSFSDYFNSFLPLLNLFQGLPLEEKDYELIVYMDKNHVETVKSAVKNSRRITVVEIDSNFLSENIPVWKRLEKEEKIMASDQYKKLMGQRVKYPEHSNAKYTLINHAKIDFINHAMKLSDSENFCWVDFGYFQTPERIPTTMLDLKHFQPDRITYTLINALEEKDKDILYTLHFAPERIGGFFFLGNRKAMSEYQKLYHEIHRGFQDSNLADDDQHLALRCYFRQPELFSLHNLGGWHKALVYFQKINEPQPQNTVEPRKSLTEIMNFYGSDKGNGHHNYTEYYSKLFEPIRDHKLNVLEIGIGTVNPALKSSMCGMNNYRPGSSLRGWRDYFPNAEIYGCDVDKDILFREDRISTFYLDQTKPEVLQEQIVDVDRMYDIIVDDGLHCFPVNWMVLKKIFCKLKKGGIYIIEDIVDYTLTIWADVFMSQINFEYMVIPNEKNNVDNNITIARWK